MNNQYYVKQYDYAEGLIMCWEISWNYVFCGKIVGQIATDNPDKAARVLIQLSKFCRMKPGCITIREITLV